MWSNILLFLNSDMAGKHPQFCNTPVLNSCNLTLIINVIMSLNQVWMNSIKSYPNSKARSDFYFSFEIGWSSVKVPNTIVVLNTLIYI
jgi:hypothetical protein